MCLRAEGNVPSPFCHAQVSRCFPMLLPGNGKSPFYKKEGELSSGHVLQFCQIYLSYSLFLIHCTALTCSANSGSSEKHRCFLSHRLLEIKEIDVKSQEFISGHLVGTSLSINQQLIHNSCKLITFILTQTPFDVLYVPSSGNS